MTRCRNERRQHHRTPTLPPQGEAPSRNAVRQRCYRAKKRKAAVTRNVTPASSPRSDGRGVVITTTAQGPLPPGKSRHRTLKSRSWHSSSREPANLYYRLGNDVALTAGGLMAGGLMLELVRPGRTPVALSEGCVGARYLMPPCLASFTSPSATLKAAALTPPFGWVMVSGPIVMPPVSACACIPADKETSKTYSENAIAHLLDQA
jgi:hypothetical protein